MLAAPLPGGCSNRLGIATYTSTASNVAMTQSNIVTSTVDLAVVDAANGIITLDKDGKQLAWEQSVSGPVFLGWKLIWDATGLLDPERYQFIVQACCFNEAVLPLPLSCTDASLTTTDILANVPLALIPNDPFPPATEPRRTFISLLATAYTTAGEVLFSNYDDITEASELLTTPTWNTNSLVTADWYFYTPGAYPPQITCDIPDCCAFQQCGCASTCSPGCGVPAPVSACYKAPTRRGCR